MVEHIQAPLNSGLRVNQSTDTSRFPELARVTGVAYGALALQWSSLHLPCGNPDASRLEPVI